MNLFRMIPAIPATLMLFACAEPTEPEQIVGAASSAPSYIGSPAEARPVEVRIPPHPHMGAQGLNAMHADGYSSDVHPGTAPLGMDISMVSRRGITKIPGGSAPP